MVKGGLGIALGGGAARGYAHIGVLNALKEENIIPDFICGTSMGAVIGGLYSLFGSVEDVMSHLDEFLKKTGSIHEEMHKLIVKNEKKPERKWDNFVLFLKKGIMYGKTLTSQSMVSSEIYDDIFDALVPDVEIQDLKIPFGAIVTDLISGEELLVRNGSLRKALKASSAIPGVYPPFVEDDFVLVDGGWTNKVPVNPCFQMGSSEVLAVCVAREMDDTDDFMMGMDIIVRANAVSTRRLSQLQKEGASLVLFPDVSHIHWADFSAIENGVEAGYLCVKKQIKDIIKIKKRSRWSKYFKSKKKSVREITL